MGENPHLINRALTGDSGPDGLLASGTLTLCVKLFLRLNCVTMKA